MKQRPFLRAVSLAAARNMHESINKCTTLSQTSSPLLLNFSHSTSYGLPRSWICGLEYGGEIHRARESSTCGRLTLRANAQPDEKSVRIVRIAVPNVISRYQWEVFRKQVATKKTPAAISQEIDTKEYPPTSNAPHQCMMKGKAKKWF